MRRLSSLIAVGVVTVLPCGHGQQRPQQGRRSGSPARHPASSRRTATDQARRCVLAARCVLPERVGAGPRPLFQMDVTVVPERTLAELLGKAALPSTSGPHHRPTPAAERTWAWHRPISRRHSRLRRRRQRVYGKSTAARGVRGAELAAAARGLAGLPEVGKAISSSSPSTWTSAHRAVAGYVERSARCGASSVQRGRDALTAVQRCIDRLGREAKKSSSTTRLSAAIFAGLPSRQTRQTYAAKIASNPLFTQAPLGRQSGIERVGDRRPQHDGRTAARRQRPAPVTRAPSTFYRSACAHLAWTSRRRVRRHAASSSAQPLHRWGHDEPDGRHRHVQRAGSPDATSPSDCPLCTRAPRACAADPETFRYNTADR